MKIPNRLTTAQVADLIHASDLRITPTAKRLSKARIGKLARANGWGFDVLGKSNLYDEAAVQAWLITRQRGLIQATLKGASGFSQIPNDIYDFDCPECGCLALPLWPATPEDGIKWMAGELPLPWLCKIGHRGECGPND